MTDFPFLTMSSHRGFSSPQLSLKICCIANAILKEIPSSILTVERTDVVLPQALRHKKGKQC